MNVSGYEPSIRAVRLENQVDAELQHAQQAADSVPNRRLPPFLRESSISDPMPKIAPMQANAGLRPMK